MASITWQVAGTVWCRRAEPAQLLEERVYPSDFLEGAAQTYHVRAHKCSQADACRDAGLPCCWTGLNPSYDPFVN